MASIGLKIEGTNLVGIGSCADTDIIIPNFVTSIGMHAFDGCSNLTSVVIPNSVTSIGLCAFYGCSKLTSITIPNSVTKIGQQLFYGCNYLSSIVIPNSVTSIGAFAFSGCNSLENVYYNGDIEGWLKIFFHSADSTPMEYATHLYMVDENGSVEYEGNKYKLLIDVVIPEGVTSVGDYALLGCSSLTSIIIPDSVTSIGYKAFYGCSNLTNILVDENNKVYDSRNNCNAIIETSSNTLIVGFKNTIIPNSVTKIGDHAFYGCSSLKSIIIPETVSSIGEEAFYGCCSLNTIIVDKNNKLFDSRDNCNAIIVTASNTLIVGCKNTIIPNSVTKIGDHAFYDCSNLTNIVIPNSVTSIGDFAFSWCSSLTNITIPDGVTSIGSGTFINCDSLTNILFPESVTDIGIDAFDDNLKYNIYDNCKYLGSKKNPYLILVSANIWPISSFKINPNTKIICSAAFYENSDLVSVTIPNSVTHIGYGAFWGCYSLEDINIPDSVISIGTYAFSDCSSLNTIIVDKNNKLFDSRDNCNAIIVTASNTLIVGCKNTIIPNSVTSIGKYAFDGCSSITNITIPDGVTSIGDYAFRDCSNLTIFCEAKTMPSGWYSDWNYSNCPVYWNKKRGKTNFTYIKPDKYSLKDALEGDEWAYYNLYGELPTDDDW